jgi:hypothetical protein
MKEELLQEIKIIVKLFPKIKTNSVEFVFVSPRKFLHIIINKNMVTKNPIQREPIEKAVLLAAKEMEKHGIHSEIGIDVIPEDREESDFVELVRMWGKLEYDGAKGAFDFYVVVPLAAHRTSYDWSWIIAHNFFAYGFNIIREKKSLDVAIEFHKKGIDIVDDLIHTIRE